MKTILGFLFVALLLTTIGSGCGGNQDKGINSGKDKPKPAPADQAS